ncbi:conserved hypothetical protein [Paecilomyces variotii No. 5]|uniref:RING-type domain-containing protein n=1 Tax=Byssochlamys spectabilis (strain No. 5 / NBRC 109023) TaxID=1356009 RepID=V5G3B5_BYSSN|nr:conserved hypothetical protein [Paecilomyces variotii No. 5]
MSLYSAASSSPYDLGSIIQLYPEEEPNCSGFAVTQGRRCRCRVNQLNRQKACSLLDRGTRDLEQGHDIDGLLDQLAVLALCKRFHQDQRHSLVSRWEQKVEDFRRQDQVSTRTTPVRNSRLLSSSPFSSSSSPSTLGYSQGRGYRRYGSPDEVCNAQRVADLLQSMSDRLERMVEILEDSGENVRQRENATGSTTNRNTQREESTVTARTAISRTSSRTVEPDNFSVQRSSASTGTERTVESTRDTSEMRPSTSSASGVTPSTTAAPASNSRSMTSSRPVTVSLVRVPEININRTIPTSTGTATAATTRRTVTQKPIEGDCSICTNPLIHVHPAHEGSSTEHTTRAENRNEDENESSRLSWCKAQCGSNYHKECIDQWLSTCRSMFRNPTCPYCRAQWVE